MSEEELDEVNYILAATNNIPATSSTIAPPTTIMSTTDVDDDDRALSGITSTTASHFRPSSIATTATIVHIQGQQHQQQQAPSPVRQVKKNHVIFYDSLAPSYHTVIKVTNIGKYKKETNQIYGTNKQMLLQCTNLRVHIITFIVFSLFRFDVSHEVHIYPLPLLLLSLSLNFSLHDYLFIYDA